MKCRKFRNVLQNRVESQFIALQLNVKKKTIHQNDLHVVMHHMNHWRVSFHRYFNSAAQIKSAQNEMMHFSRCSQA